MSAGIIFLGRADTLYVYDWGTHRRSLFAPSWRFARSMVQTDIGKAGVVLSDGSLVLNSLTSANALQVINTKGAIVREFGERDTIRAPDGLSGLERRVALSADGTIWAAHTSQYRFARWSRQGELIAAYERVNDFFRPHDEFVVQRSPQPPPHISSIHEDGSGRLWITIMVPAPKGIWEANLGEPRPTPRGPPSYPDQMRGRLFHTLIEVIDVKAGRVIASQRFPFHATAAARVGEVAAYYQDEDGAPYVDIWRLRLIQP